MLFHKVYAFATLMTALLAAPYRWQVVAEDHVYAKTFRAFVTAFRTDRAARAAILGYVAVGLTILSTAFGW
jgi:hypothetical protein